MKKSKTYYKHLKIAKSNGIGWETYNRRLKRGWTYEQASNLPIGTRLQQRGKKSIEKDVAVYKGDQFIIWGSVEEVAQKLDKTIKEIRYLCYPSHRKRVENAGNRTYGIYIENEE